MELKKKRNVVHMHAEMSSFSIYSKKQGKRSARFRLKNYQDLLVHFIEEQDGPEFFRLDIGENAQELFKEWISKEKEIYVTFITNYLNEFDKLTSASSFEGEVINEQKLNSNYYEIYVKFHKPIYEALFTFNTNLNTVELYFQLPIPINSEGDLAQKKRMNILVKEDILKKMWDPFRSKTSFRLQLLHMLR